MNLVDTVKGFSDELITFIISTILISFLHCKKKSNKIVQKSRCQTKKQQLEFHNEKNFTPKIYMKIINEEILNSEL